MLDTCPIVLTPSGGRHVWVRLAASEPGYKLARYAAGKTKIEVRGEGHQVLAPGCPAECHASGKLYEFEQHGWLAIATADRGEPLPESVWHAWVEKACELDEYHPPEPVRTDSDRDEPAGEDAPGSDFNRRGTWADTGLFDHGWTWARKLGDDRGFITRALFLIV